MRIRRPKFFALLVVFSLLLCITFGVAWIKSRQISTAAVPSTSLVQTQLARPLPAVDFRNVTLKDTLDFIRDVTGSNLRVDWAALEAAGISNDTPITWKLRNVPLGEVLAKALASGAPGAVFSADEQGIRVTMKGTPWREPAPQVNASLDPVRAFELRKRGNVPAPVRLQPLWERVVGVKRYTLVMDRGLMRLWITPSDPAAIYQQGAPIGNGGRTKKFAFAGVNISDYSSPLDMREIEVPLWVLLTLSSICPLIWLATVPRRRRRTRGERRQCIYCGYDLRATPQRCPECGREVASAEAGATVLRTS